MPIASWLGSLDKFVNPRFSTILCLKTKGEVMRCLVLTSLNSSFAYTKVCMHICTLTHTSAHTHKHTPINEHQVEMIFSLQI